MVLGPAYGEGGGGGSLPTNPTITDFSNAVHDHVDPAGGGVLSHLALTDIGSNSHAAIDAHIAALSAHGVVGDLVGTAGAQTLVSKTLTQPIITDFTNATHTHATAAQGGVLDHTVLSNIGVNSHASIDTHIAASTNAHGLGVGSAFVGTTDTQTLTNKTLTTPTIVPGGFANMQHLHASAADGGILSHFAFNDIGTTSHADIDDHIAGTIEHGATGGVVGATKVQTLTNKTLTTPTIASLTNAQHDHSDAAGGGRITRIEEVSLSDIFDRAKGTMTITNDGPNLGLEWGITEVIRLSWHIPENIDASFAPETFMDLHMDTTQTAATSFGFKWIAAMGAIQTGQSVATTSETFTTNFESGTEDDIVVNVPLSRLIGKFTWTAATAFTTGAPYRLIFSFNRRNPDAGSTPTGILLVSDFTIRYRVFVT
jgi:hypothetical protein